MANSAFSVTGTSSGNASVLLNSYTIVGGETTIPFTSLPLPAAYSKLTLVTQNLSLNAMDSVGLQLSVDNGVTWITSNYAWAQYAFVLGAGTPFYATTASNSSFYLGSPSIFSSLEISLYGINQSIIPVSYYAQGFVYPTASNASGMIFSGFYNNSLAAPTVNAVRLMVSVSTFKSGNVFLYGLTA